MNSKIHKKNIISLKNKYYIMMALFIFIGFYKNGLYLKYNGFISLLDCFKILVLPLICIIVGLFDDKFLQKNKYFSLSIDLLFLTMVMPMSIKLVPFLIIVFIYLILSFLGQKMQFHFNLIALVKTISFGLLFYLKQYNYQNVLEQSNLFQFNFLDKIFIYAESGIFTSSFILVLGCFIWLCFDRYYKKDIAISCICSYLVSLLIYALFKQDMLILLDYMVFSLIWFTFVFIAPFSLFSPVVPYKRYIYGAGIGILTLIFSLLVNFYEGVFLAIVVMDLLRGILRLFNKVFNKIKPKN